VAINADPVYIINALLSLIIIIVGYMVYLSNKNQVARFISIAYLFYFVSHVMIILGMSDSQSNALIALRIVGYLTIIIGLYVSWKLVKTQLEIMAEKNRQLKCEIAERKRLQEMQAMAEQKYRTVFENALVAMSIVEEDMTISFCNTECGKILGYKIEEVVGRRKITDFIDPRDIAIASEYHRARRDNPTTIPGRYEIRLIAENGAVKNVLLNIAILPGTSKSVASFLDITERKQAEDRLRASLKEKEVLIKEVHHRVKNNLQIVSSLLSLQSGQVVDNKDLELFVESRNRVRSMALIHEKLYQSDDLNRINLKEYVDGIVENVYIAYGGDKEKVSVTSDIQDIYISLEKGVPCGLIINELITNCYKHAFPQDKKGEIRVSVRYESNNYILTVSDNGIGMPGDFSMGRLTSLGIQLVSILTDQLKGTINISAGNGTTIKIVFPE